MRASYRSEEVVAREMGVPWQMRGPPPPEEDSEHVLWRGQRYRPESGKWANRGGVNREWYAEYYRGLRAAKAAAASKSASQAAPKATSKGKGGGGGKGAKGKDRVKGAWVAGYMNGK